MTEKIFFVTFKQKNFYRTKISHYSCKYSWANYIFRQDLPPCFDNFECLPYRAGIPTPQRQPARRCRWILFLSIQRRAVQPETPAASFATYNAMPWNNTTHRSTRRWYSYACHAVLSYTFFFFNPTRTYLRAEKNAKIFVGIFYFKLYSTVDKNIFHK